jgi:hypothetical protein
MEAQKKRGQFRFVPPVETFVPLADPAPKRPDAFVVEGKRLDGRSPDEFRPVCTSPFGRDLIHPSPTNIFSSIFDFREFNL